jgi:Tfp pilus assembly ATPase PilU
MQLLDEHLWQFYDSGKITLEELLDKGRDAGQLQDKAMAKLKKMKAQQFQKDIGPILRT